eukprot:TRINITY_DN10267_c1_g1_i1.p1 TRINITY_DN10267_c1_g1~~TRINITY_DN10267_c1_g1_i1.p1  ORF type:complete len:395 (-),score=73.68 TRINITY_DN10267_c1_g1_i1:166-1350(-)
MSADLVEKKLSPYKFRKRVCMLFGDDSQQILSLVATVKSKLARHFHFKFEDIDKQNLQHRFYDAFMDTNEEDIANLVPPILMLGRIAIEQQFSDCVGVGQMIEHVFLVNSSGTTTVQNFLASGLVEGYPRQTFSKDQVDFILSYKIGHIFYILDCIEHYIHLRMYSYWDKSKYLKGYVDFQHISRGLLELFTVADNEGEVHFIDNFIKVMEQRLESAESRVISNSNPEENPLWVNYSMSDIVSELNDTSNEAIEDTIEEVFTNLNETHVLLVWRHALYIKQQRGTRPADSTSSTHAIYDNDNEEYGVEESKECDNTDYGVEESKEADTCDEKNHTNIIQLKIPSSPRPNEMELSVDQPQPQCCVSTWKCRFCARYNDSADHMCAMCGNKRHGHE